MSYVYMIQQGDDGPIKIGHTSDVLFRLNQLQVGCPERLFLRAVLDGGQDLERQIHADLREHRLRGEWFVPADEVRLWFIASQPLPPEAVGAKSRGGRKKAERMPEPEAKAIWCSREYPEEWRALQLMTGWTKRTAYRWLGPRGVRVGRPKGK